MKILMKYLLLISILINANIVSAKIDPNDVAAVCGEKSCDIIFKKMKKYARNGSPHAQAVLSLLYRGGFGTDINADLSVKYMKRAAKNGLAYAQYNLGLMYRKGFLVEKDESEGDSWLIRSAKAGYDKAVELLVGEKKISELAGIEYRKKYEMPTPEEGEEVLTITHKKYTLSDLVDLLNSRGYGSNKQTGSRIKGRGCGKGITACNRWLVNTPLGRNAFSNMVSQLNAFETGLWMASLPK